MGSSVGRSIAGLGRSGACRPNLSLLVALRLSTYGGTMKHIVSVVLLGAAAMLAASALAQTATKPPAKPAPATKTAAAAPRPSAAHPVARPVGVHPTIIPRRPVFVPPPPVIELDEIAVVADL